jgi:TRAP-type C4-dicarboxylate transport system permease small subunit
MSLAAGEPRALAVLGQLIDLLVIVGGAAIVVLMFGNVLSRFIFNFDVAWTTELTGFLMIWATFLGGAAAARRGAHMRVGELVGLTRGRTRRIAEILINLAVAAVLLQLVWYGGAIALGNMDQASSVLYYPMGLQYAALPVGAALALVFVARDIAGFARGEPPHDTPIEI